MTEENKVVIQRLFDEFYNGGNLDASDLLMSADIVDHSPAPEQGEGVGGVKEAFANTRRRYHVGKAAVEEIIAGRDLVVVRFRLGAPSVLGMSMFRLAGGEVVEAWHAFY